MLTIVKDVLYAMNLLKNTDGGTPLGLEVAGIVQHVGKKVLGLSVGDRVVAVPPAACFKSIVKSPAALVEKIPDDLSFQDAATMPICFTTVIESLLNIGNLGKGQVSRRHVPLWAQALV